MGKVFIYWDNSNGELDLDNLGAQQIVAPDRQELDRWMSVAFASATHWIFQATNLSRAWA